MEKISTFFTRPRVGGKIENASWVKLIFPGYTVPFSWTTFWEELNGLTPAEIWSVVIEIIDLKYQIFFVIFGSILHFCHSERIESCGKILG